jgi:thiamine-phosphate pyrophosphorylase
LVVTDWLPRLYPITDVDISGLSHPDQVERLISGGATFIQLRDKKAGPRDFYHAALDCVKLAHARGARIIINDRVDIAIATAADGVHLGQDDLPPSAARQLLGERSIIGFSTHDPAQAAEADAMPVDYIAIGPVFRTSTKANPDPIVGIETLGEIKAGLSKPLVAIGGIVLGNAFEVISPGADSVAVISDLFSTGNIEQRTRAYLSVLSPESPLK